VAQKSRVSVDFMIITRTPFRISFFGGGTDYPEWYNDNGGIVVSTSIDKYCYMSCRYMPPFFDYNFRIRYRLHEEVKAIDDIQHPSVRECLRFLDFSKKGVEIQHNADLPAMSGLGSSSAFTVCLLHSLYALRGKMAAKRQLATEAIHIEKNMIKENVGSQDQVAASFGGFNKIIFNKLNGFEVNPLVMDYARKEKLRSNLMLFFTGFPRYASQVAAQQIKNIPANNGLLRELSDIAGSACDILCSDTEDFDDFGKLLHKSWEAKKALADNISNGAIDDIYNSARSAGALGGKLLGAGNGGFMLIFARPEEQPAIREKLKNLLYVPFGFDNLGSQIIFYSHDDYA
jgi:D-glycero-alpha-D-manno-heptose-7-phosphate kinase